MINNESRMKILIPKEHGAWAMWIMPFIIGVAAAGEIKTVTWLIFGSCLSAFAARTALGAAIRQRARNTSLAIKCICVGAFEIICAIAFVLPIIYSGNYNILILGLIAAALLIADLWWIRDRTERQLSAELLGVAGFSLAAPAAFIATRGVWHVEAVMLWLISFGYFAGSVFFVKLRLIRLSGKPSQRQKSERIYTRLIVAYVVLISLGTLLLPFWIPVPSWLILGFLPWIAHMLWECLYYSPSKNIHRVGWTLVAHSIYFTGSVSLLLSST
ncbi:MAG: YwiC-like family protein [bacterium]